MPDTTLYRGISSSEIEDILKNGIQAYETKYDEARAVLSKYVNSEILTDEFLEENKDYIGWLSYRFSQFTGGAGVFCLLQEKFSDKELNEKLSQIRDNLIQKGTSTDEINQLDASLRREIKRQEEVSIQTARLYANEAAKEYPEYENYIVSDLKNLKNDITECEESLKALGDSSPFMKKDIERRLACKKILLENLKPQYKDVTNNVHIPKKKGYYPIILQIRGDLPFSIGNEQEVRLKGDLKAEDIIGVAFVPDNPKEQPTFLSKEEFLKQFQQRKEASNSKVTTQTTDKTGEQKTPATGGHLTDRLAKASDPSTQSKTEPIQRKILSDLQPDI